MTSNVVPSTKGWSLNPDGTYGAYHGTNEIINVGPNGATFMGVTATGTGRAATLTVAANNATALAKAQADFVCDGTADDVEIQAAIDALSSGTAQGGAIVLTQGSYSLSAGLTIGTKLIELRGMGKESTRLAFASGVDDTMITVGDGTTAGVMGAIRHLSLQGNKANNTTGHGVLLNDTNSYEIDGCLIANFAENGVLLQTDAANILIRSSVISDNGLYGIRSTANTVAGVIIGNVIHSNGAATTGSGINMGNTSDIAIVGNAIYNNGGAFIRLFSCSEGIITGNECVGTDTHGVLLDGGTSRVTITGNVFQTVGQAADNTYSVIRSDGDDHIIVGNRIDGGPGATNAKFGVELLGDNSVVTGNHIANCETANVLDSGTGNIIRNNKGWVTENSGSATLGGGTLEDGTGEASGAPIDLDPGANAVTITQAGTFTITLPAGNSGTAASDGWTVTGSPVTLNPGPNEITVEGGGSGDITVTTADDEVTVTHGLAATPTRVQATPTSDPGGANAFFVTDKGATTFKIKAAAAVDSATTFDWGGKVGEG